ncbi:hypothetical protein G6L09_11460 [Agrobacterium rhizogenes]|nr:hypothetical protein [Rhizobium rhizogenes]NTH71172.1 hypothetical protein [Rhizobium rhizogenes]
MFKFFKQTNFRWVDNEIEDAEFFELIKRYVFKEPGLQDEQVEEATAFLQHLQTRNLWVACDCTGILYRKNVSAREAPVLHVVDGKNLRRQHSRPDHDINCDFIKRRGKSKKNKESETSTISVVLARNAEKRPDSYGVFRRFSEPTEGFVRHDTERRNGKRISTHARLLFTLLSEAKLNLWPAGVPRSKLPGQLESIRDTAKKLEIGPGITVGDVIVSYPSKVGLDGRPVRAGGQANLQQRIQSKEGAWPSDSRPHGFLCCIASKFEGDDIIFDGAHRFPLLAHPQIFAEYREVVERPYIAIVSFAKDKPSTKMYPAVGCFAQLSFSDEDCGPVDSSYEKRTLEILLAEQSIADLVGSRFDITKPLFDLVIQDEHGEYSCRPDFVLSFAIGNETKLLPIETMGRDTKEYNASKLNTHPRMRNLNHCRELVKHNCTFTTERLINEENSIFRKYLWESLNKLGFNLKIV